MKTGENSPGVDLLFVQWPALFKKLGSRLALMQLLVDAQKQQEVKVGIAPFRKKQNSYTHGLFNWFAFIKSVKTP